MEWSTRWSPCCCWARAYYFVFDVSLGFCAVLGAEERASRAIEVNSVARRCEKGGEFRLCLLRSLGDLEGDEEC